MKWWAPGLATVSSFPWWMLPEHYSEHQSQSPAHIPHRGIISGNSDNPIHLASDWLKSVTHFWLMRNEHKSTKQHPGKVFLFLRWEKTPKKTQSFFFLWTLSHVHFTAEIVAAIWLQLEAETSVRDGRAETWKEPGLKIICHGFSESAHSGILPSGLSASLLLKPVSVSLWQNNFFVWKILLDASSVFFILFFTTMRTSLFFFFFPHRGKGNILSWKCFLFRFLFS